MDKRQQSTTNYPVGIFMASSSDHVTGVTGTSVALYISKNGGAWLHSSGTVSEIGFGWYSWAGNTFDRSDLGELAIHASGTSCDPFDGKLDIVSWNPFPDYIGTPIALDGGTATIAGMLTKFADDNNGTVFDATSDSLHGIAASVAASAPVAATAATGTATVGTVISGNFSNTWTQNSVYWQIQATGAAAIDANLAYSVGTGKLANTIRIVGRYQVAAPTTSKFVTVEAWNYKTLSYDVISSTSTRINGQTASTDNTYTYALTVDHLSTLGAATIRFVGSDVTATSNLYLDYVAYLYQTLGTTTDAIAQAVYLKMRNTVYDGGVYIDTINGVAGTVIGDNGTAWNPVNTLADALTIANTLGVKRLYFRPDSEITLNQSFANWRFIGRGVVHLNGQSIDDAWFQDLEFVDGISSGTDAIFQQCIIGSGSFYPVWFDRCAMDGSVTFLSAGEYTFESCYDGNPNVSLNPTFIFSSGALAGFRDWNGGIALSNMVAGNYATVEGMGRVVINSNCTGGNITIRGFFPSATDNVPGGFLGTLTDTNRYGEDQNTYAITNGWVQHSGTVTTSGVVSITGTVDANIVSSNNIDFTALQKTSLNAATPASVGTVTGNVVGSVGSVLAPVTVVGYVNVTGTVQAVVVGYVQVTGTVDANVEKWNTVDVVSGAIPAFAAGTAGGIPTVDLNNYIAGIQGTKNQLDDLNDLAAGAQMDLVNAPNALAVTSITNDLFTETIEGTTNFKKWIRRMGAALFGKANGGGSAGSKKFRDTTDTVNRIDATTDANGNRTSVTFDDTDT